MVEQRTHKPLVAGSIPAPGTNFQVYHVYMIRGSSDRHYIGQTSNLTARLIQHRNGQTHTTKRLGGNFELVASMEFSTREEAMSTERLLKSWKSPRKAAEFLADSPR